MEAREHQRAISVSDWLVNHGIQPTGLVHRNLTMPPLVEAAVRRREGELAETGAFVAITVPHTGRSPADKFIVEEPSSRDAVWWGKVNRPMQPEHFDRLLADVQAYLTEQEELFVQDLYAGADPAYRLRVGFVTTSAWHAHFVRNMFIRPEPEDLEGFEPDFTVLHAPDLQADPAVHGTRSGTFIILNFARRTALIGGTRYAGELKKAIFTVMNFLLPGEGVLPMHCSANIGEDGDTALFFGLSGTGKTTLSADPDRMLIGDDEHGWSDAGVFNFEGGCYAKVIDLSADAEPDIYAATQMFGTVLENVTVDPRTRRVEFSSQEITENTRASYPIHFVRNHVPSGRGGHPENILFLTADAFGVLPPVARLTPEQGMYYFMSGYTAKVAGTERGVTEPQATFSACFGAVFLVRHPTRYAELLGERIRRHGSRVWLVNTGWTGGPYGIGARIRLRHTRAIVRAVLAGELDDATFETDPVFRLAIPTRITDVPPEILRPRETWNYPADYDAQARQLATMFRENFEQFEEQVDNAVARAGPTAEP